MLRVAGSVFATGFMALGLGLRVADSMFADGQLGLVFWVEAPWS